MQAELRTWPGYRQRDYDGHSDPSEEEKGRTHLFSSLHSH